MSKEWERERKTDWHANGSAKLLSTKNGSKNGTRRGKDREKIATKTQVQLCGKSVDALISSFKYPQRTSTCVHHYIIFQ